MDDGVARDSSGRRVARTTTTPERVLHRVFRATIKPWEALFSEAAAFAGSIDPSKLVTISHSSDLGEGVVVVWYWGLPKHCRRCGYDLTGNTTGKCSECGTET
ncbi:MAG: hypothetical protein HOP29_06525 [Phycisphaerales bacterium]|nr:hypothetical protein [Phycisphaerales bacterium]